MKNTFKNIQVNHFIFEQGDASVLMDCNIKKGNKKSEHIKFHISQTDLNLMVNKLCLSGINPMDFCESYSLENGNKLYEIDLSQLEDAKRSVLDISFYNPAIKIRA